MTDVVSRTTLKLNLAGDFAYLAGLTAWWLMLHALQPIHDGVVASSDDGMNSGSVLISVNGTTAVIGGWIFWFQFG